MKDLKKNLPKRVSFLAPLKTKEGVFVRVKIDNDFYRFSIPSDYSLNEADWTRIVTLITRKLD